MSGDDEIQNTWSQQPLFPAGLSMPKAPNHWGKSGRELEEIKTNMGQLSGSSTP